MKKNYFTSCLTFTRQYLKSPRSVGAVCPSWSALARTMVSKVPQGDGLVIELGAGTGAITKELLKSIDPHRLLIIEQVDWMVEELKLKFPQLNIIQGDAAKLSEYIPATSKVDCIVSSIPFVSLNNVVRQNIISEVKNVLEECPMIQFTYSWGSSCLADSGFTCISKRTVWKNFPPAQVMEFRADKKLAYTY